MFNIPLYVKIDETLKYNIQITIPNCTHAATTSLWNPTCQLTSLRQCAQVKPFTALYNYPRRDSTVLPHLHLRGDVAPSGETQSPYPSARMCVRG